MAFDLGHWFANHTALVIGGFVTFVLLGITGIIFLQNVPPSSRGNSTPYPVSTPNVGAETRKQIASQWEKELKKKFPDMTVTTTGSADNVITLHSAQMSTSLNKDLSDSNNAARKQLKGAGFVTLHLENGKGSSIISLTP